MFDTNEFNEEVLNFLRENTYLGPISLLKIAKAKKDAESYRKWYLKQENELLESDYSFANEMEYEMRMRAWENKYAGLWKQNQDGLSLAEFARMALEQQMNEYTSGRRK